MTARAHFRQPLLRTAFDARTARLNLLNRWGAWAGYTTPLCYGDAVMEYTAIRNAATLYDLCPMVKYRIAGPEAAAMLDRLTLRDVSRLPVGGVQYTAWVDDHGKVLDDGTLFHLGPNEFLLCCQERHLPWMLDTAEGFDARVTDVTSAIAALSLQGPTSAAVLRGAGFDASALKPFRLMQRDGVTVSRTGFTGDLGYELWCEPGEAPALWDRLMEAGRLLGLRPAGSEALEIARIEAGFLLTNADFVPAEQALREDRVRSPFELGLDWMMAWDKPHFTGKRALEAERARGSDWALVGLDIDENVSAEQSLVYLGRTREVGVITSACWSPTTKRSIALAQVRRPHHRSTDLWVEVYARRELSFEKLMLHARVVERPFFVTPRRRATPPGDF
jgi:aminomethyltransferase